MQRIALSQNVQDQKSSVIAGPLDKGELCQQPEAKKSSMACIFHASQDVNKTLVSKSEAKTVCHIPRAILYIVRPFLGSWVFFSRDQ